jgi:alkyl hydroperoxide reductase subunit AhpC
VGKEGIEYMLSQHGYGAEKEREFAAMRSRSTAGDDRRQIEVRQWPSLRLGDTAPDFTQDSTQGPVHFYEWMGDSWAILFSHPADFTPVCTTELGTVARLKPEFDKRNVKAIGLSVDPQFFHEMWVLDIAEIQGIELNFPLLADANRKVAQQYGMIHPNAHATETVRSVFIIDPKKVVRLMHTYPSSTGRNFDELLRVIDSLQLTDRQKVATPANWKLGDDVVILPSVRNDEADKLFPRGYKELKPYFRVTPNPTSSPAASSPRTAYRPR